MTDRAKQYSRIRHALTIVEFVYMLLLLVSFQTSGIAVWFRGWLEASLPGKAALVSLYYRAAVFGMYLVLTFPFSFYGSYAVERRFGLSNEKAPRWFLDYAKASLLSFLFFMILTEGLIYFLRFHPSDWWWMSSLFWLFFSIVLARIFPVLVIPLFFKYKRIDSDGLRGRISKLAAKMGMKILDIYEIDFSRKSAKANAGLVGLGRSKRVILTDTLKGKFSDDEIEVILAHEFAHFRLRHMIKLIIINAAATFVIFYVLFRIGPAAFGLFGLELGDIAGLATWIFLFAVIQAASIPLLNFISRNMEANADRLAVRFSANADAFVSMLEKLAEQNLAERNPSLLTKIFFYDHPPIEERIEAAKKGF